jgi:hypothetical protein
MIDNRPKYLLEQDDYKKLPSQPFAVDFEVLPELVRQVLGRLGGIQPVTGEMARAANGELNDTPSDGEIALFKNKGTLFQPVFLVLNIAHLKEVKGTPVATPYALSLMPTSKRDVVDEKPVELVAKLDAQKVLKEMQPCYASFDPFRGDWRLFGPVGSFIGEKPIKCFLDELGLVVGQYYLAKSYDQADVLEEEMGFPSPEAEERYRKHRAKLLYKPFTKAEPRRVWGAQSPIELFLFQESLRRDLAPLLQVLVCEDASIHPSLYHLWRDLDFRYAPGLVTEPDLYFPERKLAVFCDSTRHHRGDKAKAKDARIDAKLANIGFSSLRIPGKLIVEDVNAAADLVASAIEK